MKVKELIEELQKLPPECDIIFESYYESFDAKVCWDITMDKYAEGYKDEPYIFLTQIK